MNSEHVDVDCRMRIACSNHVLIQCSVIATTRRVYEKKLLQLQLHPSGTTATPRPLNDVSDNSDEDMEVEEDEEDEGEEEEEEEEEDAAPGMITGCHKGINHSIHTAPGMITGCHKGINHSIHTSADVL